MAIGNEELMHECFPKHFGMGTARIKDIDKVKKNSQSIKGCRLISVQPLIGLTILYRLCSVGIGGSAVIGAKPLIWSDCLAVYL